MDDVRQRDSNDDGAHADDASASETLEEAPEEQSPPRDRQASARGEAEIGASIPKHIKQVTVKMCTMAILGLRSDKFYVEGVQFSWPWIPAVCAGTANNTVIIDIPREYAEWAHSEQGFTAKIIKKNAPSLKLLRFGAASSDAEVKQVIAENERRVREHYVANPFALEHFTLKEFRKL